MPRAQSSCAPPRSRNAGTVVALVVVLADHLPVGGHLVADGMADAQLGERITVDARRHRTELLRQRRRGRGRQMHEYKAAPAREPDRIKTELCRVEAVAGGEMRGGDQPPVKIVGPLVIGTGDAAGGDAARQTHAGSVQRRLAAQPCAAMAADVVEAVQLVAAVARQQNALAEDVEHPPGARLRQLLFARDAQPFAAEDALLLECKHPLRTVPARGQRRLESRYRRRQLTHACLASGASRRAAAASGSASSSRAKRWPL